MKRDITKYGDKNYDMIIIGGGIYGIMLSLEAVRRGLKPLLLEKKDFGGNTSLNHLKTVHGGLRYLQSADFLRFFESVKERKWFLKYLPEYVNIMSCLMPLYGKGLHRNSILFAGLFLNDTLSITKNIGIVDKKKFPFGKLISKTKAEKLFSDIDKDGLTGAAEWFDASLPEQQRFYMRLLKESEKLGAVNLNYVEVKGLKNTNTVEGVFAKDKISGKDIEFNSPIVINAAGPDSRKIAAEFDRDYSELFRKRLLLWNVLFDRESLSKSALALNPIKGGGHTYFSHPWKGRFLIGTGEIIVNGDENELRVPESEMKKFIDDINKSVPGLNLSENEILRVYSGVLPANENGRFTKREAIIDHYKNGGPKGLYSLAGIKFTTSRLVAEKLMKRIFPQLKTIPYEKIFVNSGESEFFIDYDSNLNNTNEIKKLEEIIKKESVFHLGDLVLRRTTIGDNPKRALDVLQKLKPLFDFNEDEWKEETEMLKNEINIPYETVKQKRWK